MTKIELSKIQEAFKLVYQDKKDGDWEKGMKIIADLAGISVPAFEIGKCRSVPLHEIASGPNSVFKCNIRRPIWWSKERIQSLCLEIYKDEYPSYARCLDAGMKASWWRFDEAREPLMKGGKIPRSWAKITRTKK